MTQFIRKMVWAVCFLWSAGNGSLAAQATERPNIWFCIADDWSYPHAGVFWDKVVRTPNIDRLARQGMVFTNAFCAAPSCTPSRAAILTGRYPHELEQGGNLWSFLPTKFKVVPDVLEDAGYAVGHTRKGWGPGNFRAGGRERNPAGPNFRSFGEFLEKSGGKPIWFWFGSQDPHRPYVRGSGAKAGLEAAKVDVPKVWPDTPEIRNDILDYYFEVERFDREIGELLADLEKAGKLKNTIVIVTADNGMPFPRAKANLYDLGARVPLVVWGPGVKRGTSDAFVNLADLGPTFLEFAGVKPVSEMSARSIASLVRGEKQEKREMVFLERERHANVRKGDLSYPSRAVRTKEFLYIRNLRPERWPAGDPEMHHSVGPYGDCDNSPTKAFIVEKREAAGVENLFQLGFGKRPAEELYDLEDDTAQMKNVATDAKYAEVKDALRRALNEWMKRTNDPRVDEKNDAWSAYDYFGGAGPRPARVTE
ncbi:MAG TPA: sulfatase [Verrucomicrobiae bacterium]